MKASPRMDSDRLADGFLRTWGVLVYAFLYAPILVVVIYAFNGSRLVQVWDGFSLRWFAKTFEDETVRDALWISVRIATANVVIATILGTAAAIGLRNVGRRARQGYDSVLFMTLTVPEIVIAIATLVFFTTVDIPQGFVAIVIAHSVFNTSVVTLIVRARLAGMDRSLEEASADLGASRFATFRQVTLVQLRPAIFAGALLAFTFSFDDVVLSSFLSGPGSTTLPIRIFSEVRFGLTPTANVIGVFTLTITLVAVTVAELLLRRNRASAAEMLA